MVLQQKCGMAGCSVERVSLIVLASVIFGCGGP
jgi:hypothetical protein